MGAFVPVKLDAMLPKPQRVVKLAHSLVIV